MWFDLHMKQSVDDQEYHVLFPECVENFERIF